MRTSGRSRRTFTSFGAAAAALALISAGAGSASAATVTCGQTITQNLTLSGDLGPCSGNGLTIAADNVTLDLNGHSITGPFGNTSSSGVDLGASSGVTVTHGSITGFGADLRMGPAGSYNRATALTVRILDASSSHDLIAFNRVWTIGVSGSFEDIVANSGGGISAIGSNENIMSNNLSSITTQVGSGVFGPQFQNDVISNNAAALRLEGLGNSTVAHNDGPITLTYSDSVKVQYNHASSIDSFVSSGDVFFRNRVRGGGISLRGGEMSLLNCCSTRNLEITRNNVLLGNTVTGSYGDGIFIEGPRSADAAPGVENTLVRHNRTNRNKHDGIVNHAPSTTLINNTANHNSNFGIESVPGAADGGGNRADFNGVGGCTNLVCG